MFKPTCSAKDVLQLCLKRAQNILFRVFPASAGRAPDCLAHRAYGLAPKRGQRMAVRYHTVLYSQSRLVPHRKDGSAFVCIVADATKAVLVPISGWEKNTDAYRQTNYMETFIRMNVQTKM